MPGPYHWIFFTSPTGVALFTALYGPPGNARIAVLGRGTAAAVNTFLGAQPAYTPPHSDPAQAVASFAERLTPQERVLIPRAQESFLRLHKVLQPQQVVDFPFYRTAAAPPERPSHAHGLLFTSPANARAYFGAHRLGSQQIAVAMGKSTWEAIATAMGGDAEALSRCVESKSPDERGLWDAFLSHWLPIT